MNEGFDLQNYLLEGVEGVVKEAIKATIKNPRESAFMLKFAAVSRAASKKRRKAEDNGEHIPPFLIASITSSCNLLYYSQGQKITSLFHICISVHLI